LNTVLGLFISFLGAFYYHGTVDSAMKSAGQNTLERIVSDNDWNHILFNARLFRVWLTDSGTVPVSRTPSHI